MEPDQPENVSMEDEEKNSEDLKSQLADLLEVDLQSFKVNMALVNLFPEIIILPGDSRYALKKILEGKKEEVDDKTSIEVVELRNRKLLFC